MQVLINKGIGHLRVNVEAESELQLCPVQSQGEDQGSLCATLFRE